MSDQTIKRSAVIRFLTGPRRGEIESLQDSTLFIIKNASDGRNARELSILPPDGRDPADCLAILHRNENSYELEVCSGRNIWINGAQESGSCLLQDGDLIELEPNGSLIRFRLFKPGTVPAKSLKEALADSIEGARHTHGSRVGTTKRFLLGFAHDLARETTARFRLWTYVVITSLIVTSLVLVGMNIRFQKTLREESIRIEGLAKILAENRASLINREDFDAARRKLEAELSETATRINQLEGKAANVEDMLELASRSIAFVQGEYGFLDLESGLFLRYTEPMPGLYLFTLDETAEKVVIPYSGTAFQVFDDGLLLTNRHIANPWEMSENSIPNTNLKLKPVVFRMQVYWQEEPEPSRVEPVAVSTEFDLAILKPDRKLEDSQPLSIETRAPKPGEAVLLIGYPLGLSGIAARTTGDWPETREELRNLDYWELADDLARKGFITPLTSSGIVSQVTGEFLVYDAATAMGGSGGPVLSIDGKVLAINTATLGKTGGANLGVKAENIEIFLNEFRGGISGNQ